MMMKRNIKNLTFALPVLIFALFFARGLEAKAVDERIYIAPAGAVDGKVLEDIKSELPKLLPMTVHMEIVPAEKLSESAYNPARKQYNAGSLLDDIAGRNNLVTTRETMLVVTDVDLYSGEPDFVFGLANPKTKICIVSLARLNNEFYGLKPDNKLLSARAVKEAAHELGHAWGLPHCPDPKCAMFFSGSIKDTDKKRDTLCHDCKKRVRTRYTTTLFTMPVF